MVLRTVARAAYRQCSRRAVPPPREQLGSSTVLTLRALATQGGSRVVNLPTKDEYLKFPRPANGPILRRLRNEGMSIVQHPILLLTVCALVAYHAAGTREERSVLYFTAKWCPPCRRIGPFFAELSTETPNVSFGKVDIDDNTDAARMEEIMSVPTFKFYKEGKEIEVISGADSDMVEHAIAKLAES